MYSPGEAIRKYFDEAGCTDAAPGDEWMINPELPTSEEVLGIDSPGSTVYLAPNRIQGPWGSSREYLQTHYNLIREDAVAPLRDAVATFQNHPAMKESKDISIYEKVHIIRATFTGKGVGFGIQFSTRRAKGGILWEQSSRLIAGSIVALTPANNGFSSICIVATIAARPLENVTKNPPEVDIFFARPEEIEFDPQKEWIMVQSHSGYYEAPRHTMAALQKMTKERFPLSKHICGLDPHVEAPDYVKAKPIIDFGSLAENMPHTRERFHILQGFPSIPHGNLSSYQWPALREILTKKLAIIQGPPGTGKTYISVAALKLMLSNKGPGDPPIVIATETNHALDQLLTRISKFEPNYIRIGSRSTDLQIRKKTLWAKRNSRPKTGPSCGLLGAARKELRDLEPRFVRLLWPLSLEDSDGHLSASSFVEHGLLTPGQVSSLKKGEGWGGVDDTKAKDGFGQWLGDEIKKFELDSSQGNPSFSNYETDDPYEEPNFAARGIGPEGDERLQGRVMTFRTTHRGKENTHHTPAQIDQLLLNEDLWKIPQKSRGAVYNRLRARFMETTLGTFRKLAVTYAKCCKSALIGKWEIDRVILQEAKVIAMTTTGLSKYRGLVSSLSPRVVLIEEAAEAIEGPIVAACFESLQHLILVGDHKQLKGHCAVHDLEGHPFYLDVSMFERLINNRMPFVMLPEQRRMAPELREIMKPIYGVLRDHPSVRDYDFVPGMGDTRSFFFTHDWPESGDSLLSKFNEMEAVMVTEFYHYLLLNGVSASRMTVLTFYNGQRKYINKLFAENKRMQNLIPTVTTVDSYQGEENDIIILSLVRSTGGHGIGFLAVDNRVCVALSRAKHGIFIFGNGELAGSVSPLWKDVISVMSTRKGESRVGDTLRLKCSNHGNTTEVKVPGDWQTVNGGCEIPCGKDLGCGHKCPFTCHAFDHSWITCKAPCKDVRPCCGLACQKLCQPQHIHTCPCKKPSIVEAPTAPRRVSQTRQERPGDPEKWGEFAAGGSRKMDGYFEIMGRARDASSPEVRDAMANVDPRLVRRHLKSPAPVVSETKTGQGAVEEAGAGSKDVPEGILIDL